LGAEEVGVGRDVDVEGMIVEGWVVRGIVLREWLLKR